MFSPDDDLPTLWVKAYQGEVSGETPLRPAGRTKRRGRPSGQARGPPAVGDPGHGRRMVPAMERNELPRRARPRRRRRRRGPGRRRRIGSPWSDLLAAFEPITTQFISPVPAHRRAGSVKRTAPWPNYSSPTRTHCANSPDGSSRDEADDSLSSDHTPFPTWAEALRTDAAKEPTPKGALEVSTPSPHRGRTRTRSEPRPPLGDLSGWPERSEGPSCDRQRHAKLSD